VPLFLVAPPEPNAQTRDVWFGWVLDWDDEARVFLVEFSEERPAAPAEEPHDDAAFELVGARRGRQRTVVQREGQQRFKFLVLQRYGASCAVCGINVPDVLDAAHLRPVNLNGTNDPRNGILLCATHHRAFDRGLFAIDPNHLRIHTRSNGPSAFQLGITRTDLSHLNRRPHPDALRWVWQQWTGADPSEVGG
jgi:putative restriction endonuclease